MPHRRKRAMLLLDSEVRDRLEKLSNSRTESASTVERAQMLLGYALRRNHLVDSPSSSHQPSEGGAMY